MSENTTGSCTRKLKRLLLILLAAAMIAGSLMSVFVKVMTVMAAETQYKEIEFDGVWEFEAGHKFVNENTMKTTFLKGSNDAEDGFKSAYNNNKIFIRWIKYFGTVKTDSKDITPIWEKSAKEIKGVALDPGKYQIAFQNLDEGGKYSDIYIATFYVNAPIEVIYRAITVDPNTGAKSYNPVDTKNAEVTTNPNGSTPLSINVDAAWCQSGYHFDNMAVVKASTGSLLKSWSNKVVNNHNPGNYGVSPTYTNSYQTTFSTKYQTSGDILYVDCYYTDNKPNIFAGDVTFPYGTSFKTDYDLISQITRGVQDDEDVVIDISKVEVISLTSTAEAESTTNAGNYRGRVLSSGEYYATLMVVDSQGAFDRKVVTFHIADDTVPTPSPAPTPDDGGDDTASLSIKTENKTYLQGTDITGAMLSTQVQIYDKVSGEILTYTDGALTQGTFTVADRGGLNSNKVTNYSFEHYLKNTAACDAENTYTITYKYKTRGNAIGTATAEAVIIPVFPYFEATYSNCQIFEGYMPIYNEDGTIASFSNIITLENLKNDTGVNLRAKSYINGTTLTLGENGVYHRDIEDVTESITLCTVTYADGTTDTSPAWMITGNGTYGDDLPAEKQEDGTFILTQDVKVTTGIFGGTDNGDGTYTLKAGSIYPFRGDINYVVEATNKFGNTRRSSYDKDLLEASNYYDKTVEQIKLPVSDLTEDGDVIPPNTYEDNDFSVILKPQTDPIINGSDRYVYVDEELTEELIKKKVVATDLDANGNESDITDNITIVKVDKYDKYGNFTETVHDGSEVPINDAKTVISTEEPCQYVITFHIKNENNRVTEFSIVMHVVDTKVDTPYLRYADLEYAIKTDDNLDEYGYNVYYDKDSVWMNNRRLYASLMYSLAGQELAREDVLDENDYVMTWHFEHDSAEIVKSWQMEGGVANDDESNELPEGQLVIGYLFYDDKKRPYIVSYKGTKEPMMYHTYVYPDSVVKCTTSGHGDYGYGPGPALNEKFYNTFYGSYEETGSGCVIDNTKVSYQGHGDWAVIRDEEGYFLYFDKDTGKRMKSLTNNPADAVEDNRFSADGFLLDENGKETEVSVYEYGLDVMINHKYADVINSNENLSLLKQILGTFDTFN